MARRGGKDRGLAEYPKGSGQWWIRYWADGREHSEKVGPKALARKRYMQRKTEIEEGRYFPNRHRRSVLFDDLVEDYRRATARRGKAIMRTDAGYRRALESFGGRRAETITAREVEEWRDKLAAFLSPASVAHYLTMLRAIFNRAVRDGKVQASPTRGVEWPEENNARVRYLADEEERELVRALTEWLRPLAIFAIHTGLRLGELLNCIGAISTSARAHSTSAKRSPARDGGCRLIKRLYRSCMTCVVPERRSCGSRRDAPHRRVVLYLVRIRKRCA
jgi:hypothetical protein